jgi:hypothetical protein
MNYFSNINFEKNPVIDINDHFNEFEKNYFLNLYNDILQCKKENFNICNTGNNSEYSNEYFSERVSEQRLKSLLKFSRNKSIDITAESYLYFISDVGDISSEVLDSIKNKFENYNVKQSGKFWYSNPGYMGWHTNLDSIGLRIYVAVCDQHKKSFFRYKDPITKEIITSYDNFGINIRLFSINKLLPLWHCVYSECERISFGIKLYES